MDLIDSRAFFTYLHEPIISALRPTSGPLRGGTVLSILGSGFRDTGALLCAFELGNTSFSAPIDPFASTFVSAQWISSTEIKCQTPPSASPSEVRVSVSFNGGSDIVSLEWGEESLGTKMTFLYYEECKISSVEPAEGIWPGQYVVIRGEGFLHSGGLSIHFGGVEASDVLYISSEELTCIAPTLHPLLRYDGEAYSNEIGVFVRNNRLDPCISNITVVYADSAEEKNYYDARIDVIVPSHGTVSGGTIVKMYGKGLQPGHPCLFGGIMSPLSSASLEQEEENVYQYESVITCVAPAARNKLSGVVSVAVGGVGGSNYTYVDDIIVSYLLPLFGPATGGTIVSVFGAGFADVPGLMCSFDDKLTAAKWISSSVVRCVSPSRTSVAGTEAVSISLVYSQGGMHYLPVDESQKFEYYEACYTHDIVPSEGRLSGGTHVMVIGEGFLPLRPLIVRFGSTGREMPASYINSTALLCNSPPALEGEDNLHSVKVVVSMNGGSDACVGEVEFAYRNDWPDALSFHPSCGPVEGGTEVNVSGKDFTHPLLCFFDFNMVTKEEYATELVFLAEATVVSPSELICQSPAAPWANAAASVYVAAASEGETNTPVGVFHYFSPLVITSAMPLSGPTSGSTAIIISGEGFVDSIDIICRFVFSEHSSAPYIVPASVLSSTLLRCSTPSVLHTGTTLLYVNPDTKVDDESVIPFKFHFYEDCSVSDVLPGFLPNPFWGNTDVIIKGAGFVLSANLLAFFGSYSFGIPVQFINSTAIRVSPPKAVYGGAEGFLEVHVSNNGGVNFCQVEEEGIFLNFSSYNIGDSSTLPLDIPIESVGPILGPISGGTKVFLNGRGVLSLTGDLACRFGGTKLNNSSVSVSAKFSSNSETFCIAPPSPGLLSTSVEVAVLISGSSTPIYVFDFAYSPVPSAIAVLPILGPTTGGTLLSIQGGGFSPANTSIGKLICVFSHEADIEGDDILVVHSTSLGTLSSPNEVQCSAPPLTEGSTFVHVSLSTDYEFLGIDKEQNLLLGHTRGDGVLYEFYTLPSVIGLDPSFGYKGGGYQIKVLGEGFLPLGRMSVRFGSSEGSIAVRGTYLSPSEILCVVPSLPPGTFAVSVSNNDQDFSNYYNDSLSSGHANIEFRSLSEEMMVISSTPRFGPVSGGSTVVIRGENLLLSTTRGGGLFCQFDKEKISAISLNDTAVSCTSPPAPGGGPIDISISLITEVGFNTSIIPGEIIYFSYVEPVVLAVQPLWGPAHGGTTVQVVGQGFPSGPHPSIRCSFGLAGCTPAVWVSEEILLCVSPLSPFGYVKQEVDFSVHFSPDDIFPRHHITKYNSAGHIQNATAAVASANGSVLPRFIYVEPCIYVDIYPKSGPSLGGTQAVVTGMFFQHAPELSVRFGTQDVSAEWLNETALLSISPAFALPGDVEISVHYGSIIDNEAIMSCECDEKVTFTYIGYEAAADHESNIIAPPLASSIPLVMGIFPSWGPSSGGTEITVFGFGFTERDYISCVFGNATSPANSTWVNSSTFRCITPHCTSTTANKKELFSVSWLPADPAAAARPVNIYSEIDVIQFEFLDNCQVYYIWPKSALPSGGTQLFIFGAGFPVNDDTYMRPLSVVFAFGDTKTTYTAAWKLEVAAFMLNSTMLQCTLPSSPLPGTAAVYIAVGGVEVCYAGNFTFYEGGYVNDSTVSPDFSSILGNGSVYVKGRGFQNGAECLFGAPPENETVVVMGEPLLDGSGLVCRVPPAEQPGTVRLGVSGALGTALFTYVPAPTVLSVLPSSGPSVGGKTLHVSGIGFLPTDTVLCLFSSHDSTSASSLATWLSSSLVICESVPPGVAGTTISVDLKLNGVELGVNAPYFYQSVVRISKVSPCVGSVIGGTVVTVEGVGFVEDKEWWCWFGTIKVPARIARVVVGNGSSSDLNEHSSLQCMSPPLSQRTQSVFVSVSTGGSQPVGLQQPIHPTLETDDIEEDNMHSLTYIDTEKAEPAWPTSGSVNGGTNVVVQLIRSNAVIDLAASVTEEFECAFKAKGGTFEVPSLATSDHEKNSFMCMVPPLSSFNLSQILSPFNPTVVTFTLQTLTSKVVVVQHLSFTCTLDLRVASVSIAFSAAASNTDVVDMSSSNSGVQVVVITGSGFVNGLHLCCKISGRRDKNQPTITVIAAVNWISEFEIHCNVDSSTLEPHASSSDSFLVTSVGVSNNGADFTVIPFTQTAAAGTVLPPVLLVVRPIIFGIDIALGEQLPEPSHVVQVAWITPGGEGVILFGKHFFLLYPPITCVYQFTEGGSFPVKAIVHNDSHVSCHIPVGIPTGTAEMQLCGGGGATGSFCSSGNATVIISPLPVVSVVHPYVGRAAGGEIFRLGGGNW